MTDLNSILSLLYIIILLYTIFRIIYDTDSPTKAIAYVLMVVVLPVVGVILYYSVGVNYRLQKMYAKKLEFQSDREEEIKNKVESYTKNQIEDYESRLGYFYPLAKLQSKQVGISSHNNNTKLLVNGETKFPTMLEEIRQAKDHIHIEYYIYEEDTIGKELADLMIQKAQEGVKVRFMYDDFGSLSLKKSFSRRLSEAGVEVHPFYKLSFRHFANRLNYRNHRKIVIIDGTISYVGGINVSDKYINDGKNELFWRDTHMRIEGVSVMNLQFIFLTDWNFCAKQNIKFSERYFPESNVQKNFGDQFVQISYSGPDSTLPAIMYSLIEAIACAKKEVLITTPYFIPEKTFIDSLKIAKAAGVDIHLLVPGVSDSAIVNAISMSNYEELLAVGIRIFRYQKGFVHAKTMVCDSKVAFVGTANLDERSFNLNFEVNATVHDETFASHLKEVFLRDLEDSTEIDYEQWKNRPKWEKFKDKLFRMLSPLM